MSKTYEVGLSEADRLEALKILADLSLSADDVYRLDVENDHLVLYRYETPRRAEGDHAAVLPPLVVLL